MPHNPKEPQTLRTTTRAAANRSGSTGIARPAVAPFLQLKEHTPQHEVVGNKHTGPLTVTPQKNNAPVQMIWGYLRDGALAAGVLGGTIYGGIKGMTTGAAMGGLVGGVAGAVLGGLAGGASGALAGYGAYNLLGKGVTPSPTGTNEEMPDLAKIFSIRAMEKGEPKVSPELEKMMAQNNSSEPEQLTREYLETHAKVAQPGDAQRSIPYTGALTGILEGTEYIKRILDGKLLSGNKDGGSGGLKFLNAAPQNAEKARAMFNQLVTTQVPDVRIKKNKLDPISGMGKKDTSFLGLGRKESELHIGSVSTPGVLLHELGHHLEHNLEPADFATVHNFLRARSKGNTMRTVGYQPLLGRDQKDTGYDTQNPDLHTNHSRSLLKTVASGLLNFFGNKKGEEGIDDFVRGNSGTDETSYHSMVYPGTYNTEFLSTTIHFFNDPQSASKLIRNDPFRVALFLYTANKEVYEEVKQKFNEETGQQLDELIHVIR